MNQAVIPSTVVALGSVAARFGAAATTYDEECEVQRAVARRVLSSIADCGNVDRILEIGCGTGTLTELLHERFPCTEIDAVDIAETMVGLARGRLGNTRRVRWHVADARLFSPEAKFPLIAGSSALHWMVPLSATLKSLSEMLEPGGHLVSGLMVNGTFEELHASRLRAAPGKPARINLPRTAEVLEAVASAGLDLEDSREELLEARYGSARDFLKSLNRQGVTGTVNGECPLLSRTELRRLIDDYDRHFALPSGGVVATYRVLYIKTTKGKASN